MQKSSKPSDLAQPSRKQAVFLQAVGGYVNTGIAIVQGLLLIPLFIYFIGAHLYGFWLASGGMLSMLTLMKFDISSMLIQRVSYFYGQRNLERVGGYFFNGMVVYICICLLFGLVGWGVSVWLPVILKVVGKDANLLQDCFQLAVAAMTIAILNECLRSFSQALLRPVIPMLGIAVGQILGIVATVWMLFDGFGLWAIPVGMLIAEVIIFSVNLFNVVSLFRSLAVRIALNRSIIIEYVRTSPALMMATVGNTVPQGAEPLLITLFFSSELTTAYMLTRKAADIVFRMLSVLSGSIMGSFSHLLANHDQKKIRRVAQQLLIINFSAGAVCFASFVGANHAFVSLWVGNSFVLDQWVVLFIGLGFFAQIFRGLLVQMLYALGVFVQTSVVVFLEGFVRIILAIGLLASIGVMGVPLAFLSSCLIALIILGFNLKKQLAIQFCLPAFARVLFSAVILFTICASLARMGTELDTWVSFVLYLSATLIGSMMLYVSMNWSRCREVYKSIVV